MKDEKTMSGRPHGETIDSIVIEIDASVIHHWETIDIPPGRKLQHAPVSPVPMDFLERPKRPLPTMPDYHISAETLRSLSDEEYHAWFERTMGVPYLDDVEG